MTGPDMAAVTSSLQNCSLTTNGSDSPEENHLSLDLNSQIALPYHWEQCLDLKTGEVYYLNLKTGMREKDPRTNGDFYSEEDEDNDDSSYDDSEESSSESSPISYSRDHQIHQHDHHNNNNNINNKSGVDNMKRESVLVVAGCKSCLMYFMVPKQDTVCPKCCGQLLHFDQSEGGSV